MLSLQEYITEVSSELIKRAADKADSLSKEGPRREQDFRIKQAERLFKAYREKLGQETRERVLRENCPKTKEELRFILETRLAKDKNANLNDIDVSNVTDMSQIFVKLNPFNIKIDKWDVSNVTDMDRMFWGCENFDADLSNWDVSNVQNMESIFIWCTIFKGKGLENWDVSNVKDMEYMFYGCKKFNTDLSNWDVSNVTSMSAMFQGCTEFKGNGLENWDISNVRNIDCMFVGCKKFNADVSNWDISNAKGRMFGSILNSLD